MRKSQIHPSRMCTDPRTGVPSPLEIALLKYCPRHQNIVAYRDAWDDEECWYLVSDLGGTPWAAGSVDITTSLPVQVPCMFNELPTVEQAENNRVSNSGSSVSTRPSQHTIDFDRLVVNGTDGMLPPQQIIIPRQSNNHSLAGFLRACGAYGNSVDVHHRWGPVINEHVQLHIFSQIVEGVYILHCHGIVHKDLKDENVLLDADLRVKLIDFGHSAFYRTPTTNPHISPFKTYGTPLFAPPEVRSGMTYVGPEGDVYALGLMLYEMNYGDLPDNVEDAFYIPDGETPFEISVRTGFTNLRLRDLCAWMVCPDPMLRPTIQEVLQYLKSMKI